VEGIKIVLKYPNGEDILTYHSICHLWFLSLPMINPILVKEISQYLNKSGFIPSQKGIKYLVDKANINKPINQQCSFEIAI